MGVSDCDLTASHVPVCRTADRFTHRRCRRPMYYTGVTRILTVICGSNAAVYLGLLADLTAVADLPGTAYTKRNRTGRRACLRLDSQVIDTS